MSELEAVEMEGRTITVIAWDGSTLAADSLGCINGRRVDPPFKKIREVRQNVFAAISGGAGAASKFFKWAQEGANPDDWPSFSGGGAFLLIENGIGTAYDEDGAANTVDAPFAFGVGGDLAMGAMAAGANAIKAVEIAVRYSVDCGAPINHLYTPVSDEVSTVQTLSGEIVQMSDTMRRAMTDDKPGWAWQYGPVNK